MNRVADVQTVLAAVSARTVAVWALFANQQAGARSEERVREYMAYPDKNGVGSTLLFCPSSIALFFSLMENSEVSTAAFLDLFGGKNILLNSP